MNMAIGGPGKDGVKTRVLIVDDHLIVRRGLTDLLNQQPNLIVEAAVESAEQALEAIERASMDLAIVDISLGQMDGIELTRRLKLKYPDLIVLILSMHDEQLYGHRAREAGAVGFVSKHDAGNTVLAAIGHVLGGQMFFRHDLGSSP